MTPPVNDGAAIAVWATHGGEPVFELKDCVPGVHRYELLFFSHRGHRGRIDAPIPIGEEAGGKQVRSSVPSAFSVAYLKNQR
jgi:hypothetical protein